MDLYGFFCRQRRGEQAEMFHDFSDVTKTSVITCKTSFRDGKTSYQLEPLTNTTRICPVHPRGHSDDNDYAYMDEMTKMTGMPQLTCASVPGHSVSTGAGPVFLPTCTIRCARKCGPDVAQQSYATSSGTTAVTNQLFGGHTPGVPDFYTTPTRDPCSCVQCIECAKVHYAGIEARTMSPVGSNEKIYLEQTSLPPSNTHRTKSEDDVYAQAVRAADRQLSIQQREKTCSPLLFGKN